MNTPKLSKSVTPPKPAKTPLFVYVVSLILTVSLSANFILFLWAKEADAWFRYVVDQNRDLRQQKTQLEQENAHLRHDSNKMTLPSMSTGLVCEEERYYEEMVVDHNMCLEHPSESFFIRNTGDLSASRYNSYRFPLYGYAPVYNRMINRWNYCPVPVFINNRGWSQAELFRTTLFGRGWFSDSPSLTLKR